MPEKKRRKENFLTRNLFKLSHVQLWVSLKTMWRDKYIKALWYCGINVHRLNHILVYRARPYSIKSHTMNQPKTHSPGKIPFSWEKKPGVSKVTMAENFQREHKFVPKLQPPPCTAKPARTSVHDFHIPLSPCAFQPPYYTVSKNGLIWMQVDHDPFLGAYKKCTRSTKSAARNKKLPKTVIRPRLWNGMSLLSCKRFCACSW